MENFIGLGMALAIGLLIGTERGWKEREAPEGRRIAGIRTFGLLGLLGGLWGLLGQLFGELVLGIAFAAVAALLIAAQIQDARTRKDVGITTVVAGLVTFALGALAVHGVLAAAAAGAVVTTALLRLKPVLHDWLRKLDAMQLSAAIKFLLISVVVLPALPNRGFGPWQALNPYELWWLVVLIAGISYAGYLAITITGPRTGILLTALFGGLASSTATTVNLARLARRIDMRALLAAGIVLSAATMFPRMLLEVAVVNPRVLPALWIPLTSMTVVAGLAALWLRRRSRDEGGVSEIGLRNPMELLPAVRFGALLALIMLLANGFRVWLGDAGLYLVAAVSGLADVDAITLSLARMAHGEVSVELAGRAILLAAFVNTGIKLVLAVVISGRRLMSRLAPAFAAALAAGIAAALLA